MRATTMGVQRRSDDNDDDVSVQRRVMRAVTGAALAMTMVTTGHAAYADSLPDEEETKVLCDAACVRELEIGRAHV